MWPRGHYRGFRYWDGGGPTQFLVVAPGTHRCFPLRKSPGAPARGRPGRHWCVSRHWATSKIQAECLAGTLQRRRGSQCTECSGTKSYSMADYPSPESACSFVLVGVSTAVRKHNGPKQLGVQKGLCQLKALRSHSTTEGRQDRAGEWRQELIQRLWRSACLEYPRPLPQK